jgi:polysaccharide export outer membrane protein
MQAVLDAVKAAGFAEITMTEVKPSPANRYRGAGQEVRLPAYVIEPPDILRIEAAIRNPGAGLPTLTPLPVTGPHLVRPDGTVNLGVYGSLTVTGLTTDEAAQAVRKHLAGQESLRDKGVKADDLVVSVDVAAYNSKKYYVIIDVGAGETVHAFLVTGNESVLDALSNVGGLAPVSDKWTIWVARRSPEAGKPAQILPVDWTGITQHGETATNYQLLPGDRVYVKAVPPSTPSR